MPHRNYRRDLAGTAVVRPEGDFVAGSTQDFTLTYTCGLFGIDDRGSLKIAFRSHTDQTFVQTDRPGEAGHVTATASNGAPLVVRAERRRNIRPWMNLLYIRAERWLAEGDTITVHFNGLRLQTFCEDSFEFRTLVDPHATYDYTELPDARQPVIRIVPGAPVVWKLVGPTRRRPGEAFRIGVKAEDRWGNPSDQVSGSVRLTAEPPIDGLPEIVTFRPGQRAVEIAGTAPEDQGVHVFQLRDETGNLLAEGPPLVVADGPFSEYWSDLHGQSEETVGTNSVEDHFAFARDRAFVDAAGHQGNDFQLTDAVWAEINRVTAAYDEPGRFVAVPGYEWSGNTPVGGDHNVWYRFEGRPIYRSSRALVPDEGDPTTDRHTARDLFETLKAENVIVSAHVGGRPADISLAHDAALEPSVEIHSAWGSFEWIVADAFEAGYRVGVVAASDGHKGRPGASYPGDAEFGSYGGLTCHLMDRLDRDALFSSFRQRRHFATTGARLSLDVRLAFDGPATRYLRDPSATPNAPRLDVSEALMGDIVATSGATANLTASVHAPAGIERIEFRDGTRSLKVHRPGLVETPSRRVRILCEGAEYRGRGRASKWSVTARLSGAQIDRIEPVNFWNPDRLPILSGGSELRFDCVTTGGFSAVDLYLDRPGEGVLDIETNFGSARVDLSSLQMDDYVMETGGLDRRMRVFRQPDAPAPRAVSLTETVELPAKGDGRYWIAVTLDNGHRAWSSPIYAFRAPVDRATRENGWWMPLI